jgi:hypothetical protein
MSGFEKFVHRGSRRQATPLVTISRNGYFAFNASCVEKMIKECKQAELLYDGKGKRIGLRLLDKPTPDSYKIRRPTKNRIVSVAASAFLEFYKIPHEKTRSYPAVWNEPESMSVLDLV